MLETWNQVTDANVAINANEIWGTRDWTQGTPIGGVLQIAEMTNARGEIGAANVVTLIGRKKFLERWKSTIMSHQIMEMLTPEAQVAIKLHKNKFQWVDPLPNETVDDDSLSSERSTQANPPGRPDQCLCRTRKNQNDKAGRLRIQHNQMAFGNGIQAHFDYEQSSRRIPRIAVHHGLFGCLVDG